mmetsp:Transcript_31837/g.96954  ORF Transcript_31837/g.96954 Transcript_31837/m.96954 type:complete len:350 (+) Transcript_31837:204-1253(+)
MLPNEGGLVPSGRTPISSRAIAEATSQGFCRSSTASPSAAVSESVGGGCSSSSDVEKTLPIAAPCPDVAATTGSCVSPPPDGSLSASASKTSKPPLDTGCSSPSSEAGRSAAGGCRGGGGGFARYGAGSKPGSCIASSTSRSLSARNASAIRATSGWLASSALGSSSSFVSRATSSRTFGTRSSASVASSASRCSLVSCGGKSATSEVQICTQFARRWHEADEAMLQTIRRNAASGEASARGLGSSANREASSAPTFAIAAIRTSATESVARSSASGTSDSTAASRGKSGPMSASCSASVCRNLQLSVSARISTMAPRYLWRASGERARRKGAIDATTPTLTSSRSLRK